MSLYKRRGDQERGRAQCGGDGEPPAPAWATLYLGPHFRRRRHARQQRTRRAFAQNAYSPKNRERTYSERRSEALEETGAGGVELQEGLSKAGGPAPLQVLEYESRVQHRATQSDKASDDCEDEAFADPKPSQRPRAVAGGE